MICPFCIDNIQRELLIETPDVIAIYDKFPVSNGHALIIPKRHCENYFDLSIDEQIACFSVLNKVKNIIEKRFNPDGFNIGINVNEAAGQTISHVHIHLIPRYIGDVPEPRGGIRGVIPDKKNYDILS